MSERTKPRVMDAKSPNKVREGIGFSIRLRNCDRETGSIASAEFLRIPYMVGIAKVTFTIQFVWLSKLVTGGSA